MILSDPNNPISLYTRSYLSYKLSMHIYTVSSKKTTLMLHTVTITYVKRFWYSSRCVTKKISNSPHLTGVFAVPGETW